MKFISGLLLAIIVFATMGQSVLIVADYIRPASSLPSTCKPYSVRSHSSGIVQCNSAGTGWNVSLNSTATQTANTIFAGPTSGGAAAPTFRALVNADFPSTLTPSWDRLSLSGSASGVALQLTTGSAIRSSGAGSTHYLDLGTVIFRNGNGANSGAEIRIAGDINTLDGSANKNTIMGFDKFHFAANGVMAWASSTTDASSTKDTGLARAAAGVVRASNGSTGAGAIAVGTAAAPCKISAGAGTPEAAVTGNVCDLFLRTDGGASTTLYVKQSGAATNTGWVGK